MARINLCLGAKGGIGKSFVAALLAQYLADTRKAGPPIRIPSWPKCPSSREAGS